MTREDRTAITLIVDRSGSMTSIRDEAQSALNAFIDAQREAPGEVLWTIVLFNKGYDRRTFNEPGTPLMVHLEPMGMTALNDAVGRTVDDLGRALAAMDEAERPGKVIVAILTDGHENSSTDFTTAQVREMVKRQTDEWAWEFVFLATGLDQFDAERMAMGLGVAAGQTITVDRADHAYGTYVVSDYVAKSRVAGPGGTHSTLAEVKAKRDAEKDKA